MLGQSGRSWLNITAALGQRLVFAGFCIIGGLICSLGIYLQYGMSLFQRILTVFYNTNIT